MPAIDTSNFDKALKTLYPQGNKDFARIWHSQRPLLMMMPKDTKFYGANLVLGLRYGTSQGRATTLNVAQANKSALPLEKFTVTRKRDYSVASIDGELLAASNDPGIIIDALSETLEAAVDALGRSTAHAAYRNGGGAIGTIVAGETLSDTDFTFTNPDDIVAVEKDMYLVFSSTDGTSGSLRTGRVKVTNVNRRTGKVTVDQTLNVAISGITAGDYVFAEGDFGAKAAGLEAWIPSSDPTSTAFFGVDRSVDTERLGGIRFDGSTYSYEDALVKASQLVYRHGGKTTHCFMNDANWVALVHSLGSRVRFDPSSEQKWGIKAVELVGASGTFKIYPDPYCQVNVAWLLQMDTWKLRSAGAFPDFLDRDKVGKILREATADAYEARMGGYYNFTCNAPAYNARVSLAAA